MDLVVSALKDRVYGVPCAWAPCGYGWRVRRSTLITGGRVGLEVFLDPPFLYSFFSCATVVVDLDTGESTTKGCFDRASYDPDNASLVFWRGKIPMLASDLAPILPLDEGDMSLVESSVSAVAGSEESEVQSHASC